MQRSHFDTEHNLFRDAFAAFLDKEVVPNQEAWEEAGVRGSIEQTEIGTYRYDKRQDRGFDIPVQVRVYALKVDELAKRYPEVKQRKRGWFSPERAAELVAESELKGLLRALILPTPAGAVSQGQSDGQAG